jgi:hypothetical protein
VALLAVLQEKKEGMGAGGPTGKGGNESGRCVARGRHFVGLTSRPRGIGPGGEKRKEEKEKKREKETFFFIFGFSNFHQIQTLFNKNNIKQILHSSKNYAPS